MKLNQVVLYCSRHKYRKYKAALAKYNRQFHGARGNDVGPLVRRLEAYGKLEGLVVGPWGNGSRDLHDLVRTLAEARVKAKARRGEALCPI